jgi:hypothetical protein
MINQEDLDERIAIMNIDGRLPLKLAERFARELAIGPMVSQNKEDWLKGFNDMLIEYDQKRQGVNRR